MKRRIRKTQVKENELNFFNNSKKMKKKGGEKRHKEKMTMKKTIYTTTEIRESWKERKKAKERENELHQLHE